MEAASELVSQRPPSAVTARDIADRAGLNHSLIYRHFGTKDRLITEVATRFSLGYLEAVRSGRDPIDGFGKAFDYMMQGKGGLSVFAHLLISGDDAARPGGYPGLDLHATQIEGALGERPGAEESPQADRDPWLVSVFALALVSGWAMLEDWAMGSPQLADLGREEVRCQLLSVVESMVRREAGLPGNVAP